ncbi:hypothetical protein [Clostridium estertheticum]|uniref:hypothetical protein n=1 Tax=Clostridium estertheticum TaxID=238834 RepID=UPI001CF28904|nr:hypothetical protein [Clostridium estertheticum]MCB2357033.1 hypothetical protein [Clostridium estertheticum]WAG42211.1 hypothetical protein LL065_05820 [Clostridium estertheticum]
MFRTIVCKKCDNNKVTIEKVRQQLYIKCSKCGSIILQAMHLEYWDKSDISIYKLRINNGNDRLIEAEKITRNIDNEENQILDQKEIKIRFMYIKEYEYIRQLEADEYMEICYLKTQING